jgi:hypothetical protein
MRHNRRVVVLAHIGNIPVEEWLPFVAPVVVLYLVGRRMSRARERDVLRVMAEEALDEPTTEQILERWRRKRPNELSAGHVPIFWPPGPEGSTAAELGERLGSDPRTIGPLVEELEELGYLERDGAGGELWLTIEGYDLLNDAEAVLLQRGREREEAQAREERRADEAQVLEERRADAEQRVREEERAHAS